MNMPGTLSSGRSPLECSGNRAVTGASAKSKAIRVSVARKRSPKLPVFLLTGSTASLAAIVLELKSSLVLEPVLGSEVSFKLVKKSKLSLALVLKSELWLELCSMLPPEMS